MTKLKFPTTADIQESALEAEKKIAQPHTNKENFCSCKANKEFLESARLE